MKKMYSIRSPNTQSQSSHDKGLTQIRNKLTDDEIDFVLEKANSNANFEILLKVNK